MKVELIKEFDMGTKISSPPKEQWRYCLVQGSWVARGFASVTLIWDNVKDSEGVAVMVGLIDKHFLSGRRILIEWKLALDSVAKWRWAEVLDKVS